MDRFECLNKTKPVFFQLIVFTSPVCPFYGFQDKLLGFFLLNWNKTCLLELVSGLLSHTLDYKSSHTNVGYLNILFNNLRKKNYSFVPIGCLEMADCP